MSPKNSPALPDEILVESGRLFIRRLKAADLPFLEQIFCSPGMMAYLGGVWTPDQTAEALNEWENDWGLNRRWYGLLVKKDTLQSVGTAGISENTIPDEAGFELSWFVLEKYQHQGLAFEITLELLKRVFEDLDGQRVLADTHPDNRASNRILEKLGFSCLGERHQAYADLPGFDTQVLWQLTRDRWNRVTLA